MALILLLYFEIGSNIGGIIVGHSQLNMAKVICAIILHITVVPEIDCALQLMRFTKNNPKGFFGIYAFFPF